MCVCTCVCVYVYVCILRTSTNPEHCNNEFLLLLALCITYYQY